MHRREKRKLIAGMGKKMKEGWGRERGLSEELNSASASAF